MSEVILHADTVTVAFESGGLFDRHEITAVDNMSLRVETGESVLVVGESGSGKSTFAMTCLGLLSPTAGRVSYRGRAIDSLSRIERALLVQPVFQDPYSSLNPRKTVGEILTAPLEIHKVVRAKRPSAVREMLEAVKLPQWMGGAFPRELSGGQRQRVAIARALMVRPSVIIFDEPTSALDVSVRAQILSLLSELRDEFGLTYLFITHDLAVAEHMATRICVMRGGRLLEDSPADVFFRQPSTEYGRDLLRAADYTRVGMAQ